MKTLEFIANHYSFEAIDQRDKVRLFQFIPEDMLEQFGIALKDEFIGTHQHIPFTRENVLRQLEEDIAFGFEKALAERGISASCMYHVIRMWNWILEEGLEHFDEYIPYGLPLLIATAEKYGFPIQG